MTVAPLPWEDQTKAEQVSLTEKEYFGAYRQYMSAHKLEDFRKSPVLFDRKQKGRIKEPDRSVYAFGRAAHTLILEGQEKFVEDYVVSDGPINPKTDKSYGRDTKRFQEWLKDVQDEGKDAITVSEYETLKAMEESVLCHETAAELLKKGQPEVTVRGKIGGVPCQSRVDWVCEERGLIVDLKTTAELGLEHTSERPCKFARDSKVFGYDRQMAFYRKMVKALTGKAFQVVIIAIEKSEPFECGVFMLSPATLSLAEGEVMESLAEYKQCHASDHWPSRFSNPVIL